MGKLKNRVKKRQMAVRRESESKNFDALKCKMKELVDEQKYVEAMDVMAEIAGIKRADADIMYWGALCYFETGDYDRAAKWINNVLAYVPHHLKAELLLANICMINERENDGLKIIENVLQQYMDKLDQQDKSNLEDMLVYYRYGNPAELQDFPDIQKFLGLEAAEKEMGNEHTNEDSSAASILSELRTVMDKHDVAKDTFTNNEEVCHEQADDTLDVSATLEKVMAKNISLLEKAKLLNMFAGACYQKGDLQPAFDLLSAALEIDGYNADILKNMAYVCLSAGEKEQALEFASKLPMVDFALLYAMRHEC